MNIPVKWKENNGKPATNRGQKGAFMNNQVWGKVKQFLEELRCENQSRPGSCITQEYKIAVSDREKKRERFERCISNLEKKEQEEIQQFLDAVERCASEECQQSYLQGYVDCVQILSGAGVLKPGREVISIIKDLK